MKFSFKLFVVVAALMVPVAIMEGYTKKKKKKSRTVITSLVVK
ncbi:MAG TPA: hypothetical protein VLG71_03140 [Candidatus Limnocylindria bacterium]|nr:hypothetical protein [Candidatus Limnocylindria bacterium]